jgi:LTXXQ motif family protein
MQATQEVVSCSNGTLASRHVLSFLLRWRRPQPRNRRNREGNREERRPRAPPLQLPRLTRPLMRRLLLARRPLRRHQRPMPHPRWLHRELRHTSPHRVPLHKLPLRALRRTSLHRVTRRKSLHRVTRRKSLHRVTRRKRPALPRRSLLVHPAARACLLPHGMLRRRREPPRLLRSSRKSAAAMSAARAARDLPNRASGKIWRGGPGRAALFCRGTARRPQRRSTTKPRSGTRSDSAESGEPRRSTVYPRARAASDPRAFSGGVLRNQSFANLAAARDPGARTLAQSTFQGRFFNPQWRRHFTHPIVIGWVGPLFWPYAYSDFIDYTFYPYAYDTFWPYAYDDVYEGMFGAYALGYGGTYAAAGPASGYGGGYARGGSARGAYARGSAGGRSVEADLCSGQTAGLTDWPIERIAQTVEPNDAQRAVLDELKDATARALDILNAACPTALPSTPTGRIEAMRQRLDAMLQAVRTVQAVVEKFYQSLNDEQKARFNAFSPDNPDQQQAQRDLTQVCGERAFGTDRTRGAARRRTAQRAQGITGCHLRSGQSVELGLSQLSGAHPGRPSAGDGATARCDAARGANRAARAREVLRLARRRAKRAFQSAQPR